MSDNEFGPVDLTGVKPDKLPRLIDLPGVKELVEDAWLAGCMKGGEWLNGVREQKAFDEYMKSIGGQG